MISARRTYAVPLPHREPLNLGARTLVMGILNITPDSFADGGVLFDDVDRAVEAGVRMAAEGADIIDIGGESTRPGAQPLPEKEELRRVLPVVERLAARVQIPISIDTYKARVAREAIGRGATIVNDVSGLLYDPKLGPVAAASGAALILMHTRGRSSGMYELAVYQDAVQDVTRELGDAIERAVRAGVSREAIVVDPGLGFAKRAEHSYEVLARLETLERARSAHPLGTLPEVLPEIGTRRARADGARVGHSRGCDRERALRRPHRPHPRGQGDGRCRPRRRSHPPRGSGQVVMFHT